MAALNTAEVSVTALEVSSPSLMLYDSSQMAIFSWKDGHLYMQTNTNNINKTWTLLQTIGGNDEPEIVFMRKSYRTSHHEHSPFLLQNPNIEEEQTTKWPKEKVQKEKQRSTKHTHKTKDRITRTPLKTGGKQFLLQ
jgi:hypothetical protein